MKKFYLNIILPTILAILLFVLTIFLIIIPRFKENIMDGKREMIKELTNSAWSILAKYEKDEKDGILTLTEAQNTAISRIQYLRYGDESKDYFWITDLEPIMIMHPHRIDLNGKNLSTFADPHGKLMFVEFVETVKKSEHGYVDYMWQWKDDSLQIMPKLSYVKLFKPWNWVIGTGIYIEDVKKEISTLTRNLIWISVFISFLIAFILFYILKQSLNIEQKRIEAENDLHESKEKYRALVEAATEGLLMLIEGKISFANSVISKITGYQTNEIIDLSIQDIISEKNNNDEFNLFIKDNVIKEGQFELNLKKKSGGFNEVLITSSTSKLYEKSVNILIIKDLGFDQIQRNTRIDFQTLINNLNIGFFRLRFDSKIKFIYASETAIRILGFDNFNELSEASISSIFADLDEMNDLQKELTNNGLIKNQILKINKKNKAESIVLVSLGLFNEDDSEQLVCDGIIEDITLRENEKILTNNLITDLKTSVFMIEQPVKDYILPFYNIDTDSTIGYTNEIFAKYKTDALLITKGENNVIGIVTKSDIQNRVLSLNLKLDNPVYLIMSAPVVSIGPAAPIIDALNICQEKAINHLVIKDGENSIMGIFSSVHLNKNLVHSLLFITENVRKCNTINELKQCYKSLLLLIKPLLNSNINIKYILNINSSFSDSIIKRVIELSINKIGKAPTDFSFICLGSEGRQEETLFTDQDNAIIYENVGNLIEAEVSEYFLNLGNLVCNSLNQIGYKFCKGNVMAKNPLWNKPISQWEKYFYNWINAPEPQNLLDATIFFDLRHVYGNETFTEGLRKINNNLIPNQQVFLYHLANNMYNSKIPQIISLNILSDKNAEAIELKACINHIIMFARLYSLQNKIAETNTIERLNALKAKGIITDVMHSELLYSYDFLMKLRLQNQIRLMDNNQTISNTLNTKELGDIQLMLLKKILSKIQDFHNKVGIDFRLIS